MEKTCDVCGNIFIVIVHNKQHCSIECKKIYDKKYRSSKKINQIREVRCDSCNNIFVTSQWNKKRCGNIECRKKHFKEYRLNHLDKFREKYEKYMSNPINKQHCKEYQIKNKHKRKKNYLQYHHEYLRRKEKAKNDFGYRMLQTMRGRLWSALRNNKKKDKTINLLGCSINELNNHLEKQFTEGMTRDNYGRGIGKWNVDHIIPCDSFDFSQESEQRKCFYYKNLQPLWHIDNARKNNKMPEELQKCQI